jgi:hypothetical protein
MRLRALMARQWRGLSLTLPLHNTAAAAAAAAAAATAAADVTESRGKLILNSLQLPV